MFYFQQSAAYSIISFFMVWIIFPLSIKHAQKFKGTRGTAFGVQE
jgi:hypothetical protein